MHIIKIYQNAFIRTYCVCHNILKSVQRLIFKWFLLVWLYFRLLVTRGLLRVKKFSGGETKRIPILSWERLVPSSVWPASLTSPTNQNLHSLLSTIYFCFATFTISSRQPTTKQVVDAPNIPSVSAVASGRMIALQKLQLHHPSPLSDK